jgi:intein/homing endonuclease
MSHFRRNDYRYTLSGNLKTEFGFYSSKVLPLIRRLYGLDPHLYSYRNSVFATVYSRPLVQFKSHEIGLPIGRKDQLLHLPKRITGQGTTQVGSLLSGLYDADGCVKIRKTTSGNYPRITIAQKTKGIVEDVCEFLKRFGISSTMYKNEYLDWRFGAVETRWFLDVNGFENLEKFMKHVGSRHPVINRRVDEVRSMKPLSHSGW